MNAKQIPWILTTVLMLVAVPFAASAHVHLDHSEPAKDAVVAESPDTLMLSFSGRVAAEFSTIEVKDADGSRVDNGEITAGNGQHDLTIGLQKLSPGEYHVRFNVISRDGHRVHGGYRFVVE